MKDNNTIEKKTKLFSIFSVLSSIIGLSCLLLMLISAPITFYRLLSIPFGTIACVLAYKARRPSLFVLGLLAALSLYIIMAVGYILVAIGYSGS